jgi:hypothetical protein
MTFRAVLFCLFAVRSSDAAVSTWQDFAASEAISEVAGRQMLWARSSLMVSCALSARRAEAGSLPGQTLNIARQLCERALVIPETAFGAQMPCVIALPQTYAGIVRSARASALQNALMLS